MLDLDSLRHFLEVARTQRVSAAARKLGVEHTTVSRHIRALENQLDTVLFEKSRSSGLTLTEKSQRLFVHAEQMESKVQEVYEQLSGMGQALSGHIRIGATEGFGTYVLTLLAADFQRCYPYITLDIMPVPRFFSLFQTRSGPGDHHRTPAAWPLRLQQAVRLHPEALRHPGVFRPPCAHPVARWPAYP